MTKTCQPLSPAQAARLIADGACLIDVRSHHEFARVRIPGARNNPIESARAVAGEAPVIFHCKSGMRTGAAGSRLAALAAGDTYVLAGGIDAWRKAGLAVEEDRSQPIEIMRQVQIVAGTLVLAGVILGLSVAPGWFALSAFVGTGLAFAGLTGWCGMARLLALMPWNRVPAAASSVSG